jgi:acetyltransferase-like isoleucine patch superfamily enzyme
MIILKKIINRIIKEWAFSSSNRMVSFLKKKGIKVGERVTFHQRTNISIDLTRPTLVEIGSDVSLTRGLTILTHGYDWVVLRNIYGELLSSSGKVVIGNNVFIGFNTTILKGVRIGDNCIIGAGSTVTRSIPPNSVAAGVPAKVICTIDQYYSKRKKECVEEAFEYAESIRSAYGREPYINEFWEEFPLFLDGESNAIELPIKKQLGHMFDEYKLNHKAKFNSFEEFLIASKKASLGSIDE